jgi:CBS domain-containing protein
MATVASLISQKGNQVFTMTPDQTVLDALKLMAERNIGAVLVMESERVVGIFSERDYARRGILKGNSESTPLNQVMSTTVFFINLNTSLGACLAQMTDKHIRHLPVVDEGKVVGIISIGDVVKAIIDEKQSTIAGLENFLVSTQNPM